MKQIRVPAITLLLVALYTHCAAQQIKLNELSWLIGKWSNSIQGSTSYEIWEKESNKSYKGKSFVLKGADTVFMEYLKLTYKGKDLVYIAKVRGQNNGKPVAFKLASGSGGVYVFENLQHDFPQRVVYTHPAPDSIFAYIEGYQNQVSRRNEFPLKREPHPSLPLKGKE